MSCFGSLKNILIGFNADKDTATPAVSYGLSLASQAGSQATIHVFSIQLMMIGVFGGSFGQNIIASENRRLHDLAVAALEKAKAEAASLGVSFAARDTLANYPDAIKDFSLEARVHDLTILDADEDVLNLTHGLVETAIFNSGRPVIIVPKRIVKFSVRHVLAAWDGSAQAARALHDALLFLKRADKVELIGVTGEKTLVRGTDPTDMMRHLTHHGVRVSSLDLPAIQGDVGETLRRHASAVGADMIVMGAYGHSRLRQLVLGGATRSLLNESPVPLFLSH